MQLRISGRPLALAAVVLSSALTSGCFLSTITGARAALDGSLITTVETDAALTTCVTRGFTVECTYFFIDENGIPVDVTSSADLISEFGVLGVVIDPLILQVPDDASGFAGTYDDMAGTSGDLIVQSGFKSIPVDTYRWLLAEPGTRFVIAELPDGVPFDNVQYRFSLSFDQPAGAAPLLVKPMLSIKYEVGTQVFYIPMLPCETDMGNVPSVAIPSAATPQPIAPSSLPQGCQGEQYLLAGFGVFPCDFDADDDVDSDDIAIQASVRNAPALPGDRLDLSGDGVIDINDVRKCSLTCTTPGCATSPTLRGTPAGHLKGVSP